MEINPDALMFPEREESADWAGHIAEKAQVQAWKLHNALHKTRGTYHSSHDGSIIAKARRIQERYTLEQFFGVIMTTNGTIETNEDTVCIEDLDIFFYASSWWTILIRYRRYECYAKRWDPFCSWTAGEQPSGEATPGQMGHNPSRKA